jgi:peptide/nickel transport system substrate-binding protein
MGRGIIVAIGSDPPAIGPARHNALVGFYMTAMSFNGLFRICTDTLDPVPDLVSNWRAISDTVFEFTIYEGIKFHNGEEMTAEDVVASLHYVRTYPFASVAHRSVVGMEVVGRYTVRLNTGRPNSMFFNDLANQANFIMPKSLIDAGNDFNVNPIGSGPFVFQEWIRGDTLIFTAFKDYFDKERAARVESVTFRVIPEGFGRTVALETGEIDYNVILQSSDLRRMRDNRNVTVLLTPGAQHNVLYLNNELPQFDNVHKRRIIGMAIDKEALALAAFDGFVDYTWVQGPTVFPGATEEGAYRFDPAGARALLIQHNINPATLGFQIIASTPPRATMAQVVQANLADIGIPVTIIQQDVATTQTRLNNGDFQAAFMGFTQPTLLGYLRAKFHSSNIGTTNRSRVNNPELDRLIDSALAEVIDENRRNALVRQALILANQNAYQIPTHMAMLTRAWNANLAIPEHPATDFPLYLNMVYWR